MPLFQCSLLAGVSHRTARIKEGERLTDSLSFILAIGDPCFFRT